MSKTLLLADDSVVIQKLVGLSFANEDVDLITTDNGDDALAQARERKPDAILADVVMPGMSGYEVCEAIKADPELRHIPVLLLTGTFEAFDEARAEDAGSDGHITKPFEAQALVDRVNTLFASKAPATTGKSDAPGADDSFDFFEDGTTDLSAESGRDITRTASAAEAGPLLSGAGGPSDSAFDFGNDGEGASPLAGPDVLGEPLDLDRGLAEPNAEETVLDLNAAGTDTTDDALSLDELADSAIPASGLGAGPMGMAASPAAPATTPISEDDLTEFGAPLDPTADMPIDDDFDVEGDEPVETHTTVIMSEGNASSAGTAPGHTPVAPSSEATLLEEDLFTPTPPTVAAAGPASTPFVAPPAMPPATLPDLDSSLDADFGDEPDDFAFDDDADASSGAGSSGGFAPPVADDYDVSSSDLGDPFVVKPQPVVDLDDAVPAADEPPGISISQGLLGSNMGLSPDPEPSHPGTTGAASSSSGADSGRHADGKTGAVPDITPVMRERIHETLEKVAWEAFADLSETMVKQVLERVESVAWEVIPQMAEALIKEEIRRMKGNDED